MFSTEVLTCTGIKRKMLGPYFSVRTIIVSFLLYLGFKRSPMSEDGEFHEHYFYKMTFNVITKTNHREKCRISEQRKLKTKQSGMDYWKTAAGPENCVAFAGETHCCFINTVQNTLKASDAKAKPDFHITPVGDLQHLVNCDHNNYPQLIGKDIEIFFVRKVMMVPKVVKLIKDVLSVANTDTVSAQTKLVELVTEEKSVMTVTKEIQFNEWLFDHLRTILQGDGFIIESEKPSKGIVANVNEYSTSKPDCLIYHSSVFSSAPVTVVSALNVHVMGEEDMDSSHKAYDQSSNAVSLDYQIISSKSLPSSSSESVNIEDTDEMLSYAANASGCVLEVKSASYDRAAWNECYYNMFRSGTKIATHLLEMGKIVQNITVYGIVVNMQDSRNAQALKLVMNFSQGNCSYYYAIHCQSFVDTLNGMLTALKN